MTTTIEYALMAGASYISTRPDPNKFPIPQGWTKVVNPDSYFRDAISGFEAVAFTNGTDIVISFAGTYPTDITGDQAANIGLATGFGAEQLNQAAEYYLQVKVSAPAGATITLTGHSLGGGLAALIGVFFGESATTFDQAPFANTAEQGLLGTASYALDLKTYLIGKGYSDVALADLTSFLQVQQNIGGIPNSDLVTNVCVQGEFLSTAPLTLFDRIGTTTNEILNSSSGVSGFKLHAQSLLTAFLQSDQTAATGQALNDVTFKLPDLLKMIFDPNLYSFDTNKGKVNLLEHLVRHEAGVIDPATGTISILADAMVTSFTADLWKIAQEGGLTLNEANLSRALTAFAMQKYYDETQASAGYNRTLFTGVTGGIQFDIQDVASTPAAAKGYADFRTFLEQYYTTATTDLTGATVITISPDKNQILAALSGLRDWYIQAGADAMNATDTLNRNAFMFGDTGNDILTGGTGSDLLVGNAGADTLTGGAGGDWMIGGAGADTLDGGAGYDTYTLEGSDTIRDSDGNGILKDKAGNILSGVIQKRADGTYAYLNDPSVSVTLDASLTLTMTLADGTIAVIENFTEGDFGIHFQDAPVDPATTNTITGDISPTDFNPGTAGIQAAVDAQGNLIGTAQPYEDILVGTAGDDHIMSGDLGDNVGGGAGNDWIEAGTGSDYINGDAGNDLIEGNAGGDILAGDAGNDRIYGDTQIDTATAIASGNTDIATNLKGDWLSGGSGDDILVAGAGNDVLAGGAGSDLLIAGAGDDNILGDADYTAQFITETTPRYSVGGTNWYHTSTEPFNWGYTDVPGSRVFAPVTGATNPAGGAGDVIYAGDGADHVWAGEGDDVVYGEGGNDVIVGEAGSDILMGEAGDDTISGDASYVDAALHGDDYIDGGDGNDTLSGEGGNDQLIGGAGNDKLYGGTGANYLDGGDGNDTLNSGGPGSNLFGGAGDDDISAAGSGNYLDGEDGNDTLTADGGNNELFGGAGNDNLSATGGGNYLDGEAGTNTLQATGGNNTLLAGAGNDDLAAWGSGNYLDGGDGNNTLYAEGANNELYAGAGNDRIYANAQTDTATAIASGNADIATNLKGDWLSGGSGNDTLVASADNDVLAGGGGNDLIIAGAGDDNILGDADYTAQFILETTPRYSVGGTNWYHTGVEPFNWTVTPQTGTTVFAPVTGATNPPDSGNDVIYAGGGADHVWAGAGADVVYGEAGADTMDGEAGNDILMGGAGDDVIFGDSNTANTGDDYLDGGDGADTLWGGNGNDVMLGGAGADKLYGETGANYLDGGDGNDTLNSGGPGSNLLGGAGDDNISAAGGGNYLDGGDGNDTLVADGGNNTLFGGTGDDFLSASGGNNYLDGGDETNLLIGEMGAWVEAANDGVFEIRRVGRKIQSNLFFSGGLQHKK